MLRQVMISAILAASFLMADLPAQASTSPLTNNDVVSLAKAGLEEETIIAVIQKQDASFDISVPALLKLKQDGVTPNVLHAMVAAMSKQSTAATTEEHTNQAQAPVAPTGKKKSWLKAVAAVGGVAGRALTSAGVDFAGGAGLAGNSFKGGFLSGLSGVASRQPNGYGAGIPNQGPADASMAFAAAPQEQAYRGQAAQSAPEPGISFRPWRDPREGAFTMNVPQGWQVTGGILRTSAMDPHPLVLATSPDHRIQLFYGDANLVPREVPNRMTAMAGIREGQTTRGSWGGPILLARYQTGEQFARNYVASQLCRAPQITSSGTLPEASRQLSAAAIAYGRTLGAPAQAWVGETNFRCAGQAGYVRASTVLAGTATGQGVGIWVVMELTGFRADPSEAAVARYILNTMAGSFQLDQQWEARQAQVTRDVTGAVTRAQNQMAAAIAQNARQQAQSNQIDVMSGWEKRNKVMDGIMQRDSNTRLGIATATDDITGSHTVSNDHTYNWTRPDGTITGTNTDTPPDYSSGWRLMSTTN